MFLILNIISAFEGTLLDLSIFYLFFERKYGGKRKQIAICLEELTQFPQNRCGNAKDIEDFADLLDIDMINLKEAGQYYEIEDGLLYTKLKYKMPEEILARYHQWVFEYNKEESVSALRERIIQESEFQIIVTEIVRGFFRQVNKNTISPSTQIWEPANVFRRSKKWSLL